MASLSIARRRKAWLDGVLSGATAHGHCALEVPKLREIYERGVIFGRANAETPQVKTLVAAQRKQPAPRPIVRQNTRYQRNRPPMRGGGGGGGGNYDPQRGNPPFGRRGY